MTPPERIIALANGEPVREKCPSCLGHGYYYYTTRGKAVHCTPCNGTGRVRTEPENDAERAVARLHANFKDAHRALRAENAIAEDRAEALEAERASHQRSIEDGRMFREQLEETKRQLAEALTALRAYGRVYQDQDAITDSDLILAKAKTPLSFCSGEFPCEASTTAAFMEREMGDLREERDTALREKAEAEAQANEAVQFAEQEMCDAEARAQKAEQRLAASELSRAQMREALQRVRPPSDRDCRCRYLGDGDSLTCEAHSLYEQAQRALASPEGLMEKVRALCGAVAELLATRELEPVVEIGLTDAMNHLYAALPLLKESKE